MSTSQASLSPPQSPSPVPKTPSRTVQDTPLTKTIKGFALPIIPSPKRKPPPKETLEHDSAMRNLNYTSVILEFSKSVKPNPPSPPSNNISAKLHAEIPSDRTSPRAYQLTPHPDASSPSPPPAPREDKLTAVPRVLFPEEPPTCSPSTPLIDQSAFDKILRGKITTNEIAAKTHTIAQGCLSLASTCIDKPEECERYIFDAQTLYYKTIIYLKSRILHLRSRNLDIKEELRLLALCMKDMGRTSGDVDCMIYWFNEALEIIDGYFNHSLTREEIEWCQEFCADILDICQRDPGNSSDLEEISQYSAKKSAECESRLAQLNQRPEASLIAAERSAAKAESLTRFTIRRVFISAMTLIVLGLAISQRSRFRNTLSQSPDIARLTSLFNRVIFYLKSKHPLR